MTPEQRTEALELHHAWEAARTATAEELDRYVSFMAPGDLPDSVMDQDAVMRARVLIEAEGKARSAYVDFLKRIARTQRRPR